MNADSNESAFTLIFIKITYLLRKIHNFLQASVF